MNCSVDYEEDEEQETTRHVLSLPKGGPKPLQAPQECVGNNTNLIRTTDRQLGVARIVKRYKPLVQRRGRE